MHCNRRVMSQKMNFVSGVQIFPTVQICHQGCEEHARVTVERLQACPPMARPEPYRATLFVESRNRSVETPPNTLR
jgi:hypothetical protein